MRRKRHAVHFHYKDYFKADLLQNLLLSPALVSRMAKAGVDKKVRGEEGASDHAPAWVVLK